MPMKYLLIIISVSKDCSFILLCSAGSGSRKEGENVLFMAKNAFLKWIFSGALDRNLFIQRKSIGQPQQTQQDPYTQY